MKPYFGSRYVDISFHQEAVVPGGGMDLTTNLAIIGVVATFLGALFAGWQAWETRRQRKLGAPPAPPGPSIVAPRLPSSTWVCGIYDYPPLSMYSPGSGALPTGLFVDLATELLNKLGVSFRFSYFSYGGFYEDEDRIPDLVVGMFETRRRAARVRFSRPIYEIGLQGICRASQQGDIFEAMRDGDLRVVVYSGEVGWEFAMDELPDAVEQQRVAVLGGGHPRDTMSLLSKDYDVVLMDELSCTNFLRHAANRRKFKLAFDHPPQTFDACLAVKPSHAAYLKDMDLEVSRIRNTPWYLEREAIALRGLEKVVHRRGLKRS